MTHIEVSELPPQVVGFIGTAVDADAPVTFVRKKESEPSDCQHMRLIEYTETTLFCGDCGVPLEAFGVVMRLAHWHEKLNEYRTKVIGYHMRWLKEELAHLKSHASITPEHRRRIEIAQYWPYSDQHLHDLQLLHRETRDTVDKWKSERRTARSNRR